MMVDSDRKEKGNRKNRANIIKFLIIYSPKAKSVIAYILVFVFDNESKKMIGN